MYEIYAVSEMLNKSKSKQNKIPISKVLQSNGVEIINFTLEG